MRRIDLRRPQGRRRWQEWLRREQAHPTRVRRDAKTRAVFGGPRSPRQAVAEIIVYLNKKRV